MSVLGNWEVRGTYVYAEDIGEVFYVDVHPENDEGLDPILVIHGYPSCSYDWHGCVPTFAPEPWHVSHVSMVGMRILVSVPRAACSSDTSRL